MEEDCNVAGLCLIALTKMLPFKQPMIYGVTLNDVTAVSISTVIDALDAMDPKPTVRIVMRPELSARKYKNILKSIHGHAYIMLCPCDSSYLKHYKSSGKYVARFRQCVASLSPYVDIWETGNEINGEGWTGLSKKEAAKYMYSAWKYLYSKGMTTELTPYEFSHGDQSIDMIPWLKKYVPQQMRDHIDHVLMSYYDDDNKNGHDDWQSTFDQLAALFPNSRIGFGEVRSYCGFSKPHAYDETILSFKNQVRSYYGLKPFNDQYEGGYFWWYWQEDCLPYGYKLDLAANTPPADPPAIVTAAITAATLTDKAAAVPAVAVAAPAVAAPAVAAPAAAAVVPAAVVPATVVPAAVVPAAVVPAAVVPAAVVPAAVVPAAVVPAAVVPAAVVPAAVVPAAVVPATTPVPVAAAKNPICSSCTNIFASLGLCFEYECQKSANRNSPNNCAALLHTNNGFLHLLFAIIKSALNCIFRNAQRFSYIFDLHILIVSSHQTHSLFS
jgi:hypothetical protein